MSDSDQKSSLSGHLTRTETIVGASLPLTEPGSRWDIKISDGHIVSVQRQADNYRRNDTDDTVSAKGQLHVQGALLAPSLCHPHVHLDKAFLLSHPKYSHLQIEKGTFAEAMGLTSMAKAEFDIQDLLERGGRLLNESVNAGVTHMRAFVEVDQIVDYKCLEAGQQIKETYKEQCDVRLCAFAQLPLFSGDDGGEQIRHLIAQAAGDRYQADAIGSTPYVESDRGRMKKNVEWLIDLALQHDKHIDFHLDYNLDSNSEPLVWHVLSTLRAKRWSEKSKKTIVFGHCTRLTLFQDSDWRRLKVEIGDLPVSFVGLPTSDLYMMKTDNGVRGTMNIPSLIQQYGLNGAIGINNIGNAFTPQGCCDPVYLANMGVGVYQAGTTKDIYVLYECISTRARTAIGLSDSDASPNSEGDAQRVGLQIESGQVANLVLFSSKDDNRVSKTSIADIVYFYHGTAGREVWHRKGGRSELLQHHH